MMFDLDRFKRINDYHGHATGDQVLVTVARIMKHELRSTDIIARFGGEEFVAVLPGVSLGKPLRLPIASHILFVTRRFRLVMARTFTSLRALV
nr:GGDEF domain-containing protein [Aliamphritea spongicola]